MRYSIVKTGQVLSVSLSGLTVSIDFNNLDLSQIRPLAHLILKDKELISMFDKDFLAAEDVISNAVNVIRSIDGDFKTEVELKDNKLHIVNLCDVTIDLAVLIDVSNYFNELISNNK